MTENERDDLLLVISKKIDFLDKQFKKKMENVEEIIDSSLFKNREYHIDKYEEQEKEIKIMQRILDRHHIRITNLERKIASIDEDF